jgi:peptidoglycan/LPS O-acetylase OafA/YrhL
MVMIKRSQGFSVLFGPLKPESSKLLHLDVLRVSAAAGIVGLHSAAMAGVTIDGLNMFVDLFFVISGYVISFVYDGRVDSWLDYGRFLQKRVGRLGPLHWATLAAFVGIGFAASEHVFFVNHPELYDRKCLVPNALFLHATGICPHLSFNGPSWSISAEFFMYLAAPAFFAIAKVRTLLIASIIATIGVLSVMPHQPWVLWTAVGGCFRAIPSFLFGVLLFRSRHFLERVPAPAVAMWVGLAVFAIALVLGLPLFALLCNLYLIAIAAAAADVQGKPGAFVRFMAPAGQLTYSSYMLHQLVIMAVVNISADHVLHLRGLGRILAIVVAFLAVWPVSYVSLMAFETPSRRLISGLGQVRAPRGPAQPP